MAEDKISIVMATYNGMKYIKEQLDSIRSQTCQPYEVIICDDCSQDGTFEFIQSYISAHQLTSWQLLRNEQNMGWIKNFIKLFKYVKGDIIFCADQDDIWLNDKLEIMTSIMRANPGIFALGGDCIFINEKNKKLIRFDSFLSSKNSTMKIPFNGRFYVTYRPGCALCFRKSLLAFVDEMTMDNYPHDQLIWNIACILGGAYLLRKPVICQRRHSNSAMYLKRIENNRIAGMENNKRILLKCQDFMINHKIVDERKKYIVKECLKFFEYRIRFLKTGRWDLGFKLLKYLNFYPRFHSYLVDIIFSVCK